MHVEFSFKALTIQDAKKEVLRRIQALKEVRGNSEFLTYLKVNFTCKDVFVVYGKDRLEKESLNDILTETKRDKETEAQTKERIESSIIENFISEAFEDEITVYVTASFSDRLPS